MAEYSDLPAELQFSIQKLLPLNLFWDRISYDHSADIVLRMNACDPRITRLMHEFNLTPHQCVALITRTVNC
jgi:hypothetical protein